MRRNLTLGIVSSLAAIGILAATVVYSPFERQQPFTDLKIAVVGHDYRFYLRYPGEDRILHTIDDCFGTKNLYAPEGATITLQMTSLDFVYTVEIPELEVYEVAVPDLKFETQIVASQNGTYQLLGSQMCGYDHSDLIGEMIVQSDQDFVRTMSRLSQDPILHP